jgi:DNA (cytosine-5)-methyltransferase 1
LLDISGAQHRDSDFAVEPERDDHDYDSMKPRALDLFCCAGGATKGLQRAGFHVTGVDIKPQARYCGDAFVQADAMTYPLEGFDFIWASPPCQAFTTLKNIRGNGHLHPQLIEQTRERLQASGTAWTIENVPGAPLRTPVMLCGTMFPGLRVYRHRLFECSWGLILSPGSCNHTFKMGPSRGAYHRLDESDFITCCGHTFQAKSGKVALQIDWMTRDKMAQAIPPAYSEFIGHQVQAFLKIENSRI